MDDEILGFDITSVLNVNGHPCLVRRVYNMPCPRCGVADVDAPCVGQKEFGSRPLSYRHAGRVPPSSQRRLE